MRDKLKKIDGDRLRFSAVFKRYGEKPNWHGFKDKTILMVDVRVLGSEAVVTDHLWFNATKGFETIGVLAEGDIVEFDGRVKKYEKGYRGRDWRKALRNPPSIDWKISHPTKIKRKE